jgi:hypothetical protein
VPCIPAMLREGARCEVLPDILGRANIDVTQNIFARADGTDEWMRDMVGGRERYRNLTQRPWAGRPPMSVNALQFRQLGASRRMYRSGDTPILCAKYESRLSISVSDGISVWRSVLLLFVRSGEKTST